MATQRATSTVTGTAGNTTLTGNGRYLHVINLTGAGYVSFRFDGTTAVLGADETYGVGKTPGAVTVIRLPHKEASYVISAISDVSTVVHFALSENSETL